MKPLRRIALFIFIRLFGLGSFAQTKHYTDLIIAPSFKLSENWGVDGNVGWRHLIEEPSWSRVNLGATLHWDHKPWRLLLGMNTLYTYQQDFEN